MCTSRNDQVRRPQVGNSVRLLIVRAARWRLVSTVNNKVGFMLTRQVLPLARYYAISLVAAVLVRGHRYVACLHD